MANLAANGSFTRFWSKLGHITGLLAVLGAVAPGFGQNNAAWQVLDPGSPDIGVMELSYHAVLGKTVGFKNLGSPKAGFYAESQLWALDGTDWKRLYPPRPWPTDTSECSAYDASRGVLVVAPGKAGSTWEFDGTVWAAKETNARPSKRGGCKMVFDSKRQRIVLFGGCDDSGYFSDTWEYDGNDWFLINTAQQPVPRISHGMAFDSARGVTILFGGGQGYGIEFPDLWEYDGLNWKMRKQLGPSPGKRRSLELAYDEVRKRTVLFGGQLPPSTVFNDTWEWDGNGWWRPETAHDPCPRWWFRMAFDPVRSAIVGYGGWIPEASIGETWTFNGADWTKLPDPVKPLNRAAAGIAYDPENRRLVISGGHSSTDPPGQHDTWHFSINGGWQKAEGAGASTNYNTLRLAYDHKLNRIVGFGGFNNKDLHEYRGEPPVWNSTPQPIDGRYQHGWIAAPGMGGVFLFGGCVQSPGGSRLENDILILDGYTWDDRSVPLAPPRRQDMALAYDSRRNLVYMYGGRPSYGPDLGDFWVFNGQEWTQICENCPPGIRETPEMEYDPLRDRIFLFGSENGTSIRVWEYDGNSWTTMDTPKGPEPYRCENRLAYAPDLEVILLFGGGVCYYGNRLNDVWAYGADPDQDGKVGRLDNCPLISNPDQTDRDGDGAGDVCDCAPGDPLVSAIPGEVTGLHFTPDKSALAWSAPAGSGSGTTYDVLRGDVSQLPVGSGAAETCVASRISATQSLAPGSPLPSTAWWYLTRGQNSCGGGTYGQDSQGATRLSSACP